SSRSCLSASRGRSDLPGLAGPHLGEYGRGSNPHSRAATVRVTAIERSTTLRRDRRALQTHERFNPIRRAPGLPARSRHDAIYGTADKRPTSLEITIP